MIHFVYLTKTKNAGDLAAGPYLYFPFPEHRVVDLFDSAPSPDVTIYGGGALGNFFLRRWVPPDSKRILWGTGTSSHGQIRPPAMPEDLFDLVGLREWGLSEIWAPCPSCMSKLFDLEYPIEHEAAAFLNADPGIRSAYPVETAGLPVMENTGTMAEIVTFLGGAETVVTDSYHGVFWATLLGRKVVCVPYSSKFHWFRHPPAYSSQRGDDWRGRPTAVYPDALAECRAATTEFYRRVMEVVG